MSSISLCELADSLPDLSRGRVLCVGDVMLDRFIYGEVERISPEAPIPVLKVDHERVILGGSGNVVSNLAALGVSSIFCGVVGDDDAGHEIEGRLRQLPRCTVYLAREPVRPTTIKSRFVANGQQMLRVDAEITRPIAEPTAHHVLASVRNLIHQVDILLLSDYGKGVLTAELTRDLIAISREAGVRVLVDPKGRDYSRYSGVHIVTPNRKELSQATGETTEDDAAVISAARRLIDSLGLYAVVATRSEKGMTVVTGSGGSRHIPSVVREVADVSGAGDTVIATLAAALAAGMDLPAAAILANCAAGLAVGKRGTATVSNEELSTALREEAVMNIESKIVSLKRAEEIVRSWRLNGFRMGFTNGCFDLIHPGHVSLLEQARQRCDRLIVGLNSDDSVTALKGPQRPIQSEAARAIVLAAMASVDLIVIFGEATPLRLIETLKPDVLLKGSDYTPATVVGAEFVQSYGGSIELVPLVEGHSTTRLTHRMAGNW